MQHQNYELSALVNGRPIKEYGHNGLTFIEGRKNTVYTIRFKNNTAAQVLAIVSIDGLSVVDGKPATAQSRGFVVPAYSPVEVRGWRTSNAKSSDFVFSDKPTAYATQAQGQDINCGVVAVKVIAEIVVPVSSLPYVTGPLHHHYHHHHHPQPIEWHSPFGPVIVYGANTSIRGLTSSLGSAQCSNSQGAESLCFSSTTGSAEEPEKRTAVNFIAAAVQAQDNPDFNLGTGWGKEKEDRVEESAFNRGNEVATLSMFYTDAEGLRKVGIDTEKKPTITKVPLPQGFGGFCVPPKLVAGS